MEKDEKGNNIFDDVSANLRNGINIVLLGAPSVGKTYELKETLIPKLNKENIKVVFIDKYESLKSLNFSENFSDKIVIIDDFYKVYMKCKEDNEIFNNLLKILKNEVKCKAMCISTTPYRFEWLYEKEIKDHEIFKNYKKVTLFEILKDEAEKIIKEKIKPKKDKVPPLDRCLYKYKFIEEFKREFKIGTYKYYESYSPFALLSCDFGNSSGILSKISEGFKKIFGAQTCTTIMEKTLESKSMKKFFESDIFKNEIVATGAFICFSGISSVSFFNLLYGLLKGKGETTSFKFLSELEKASPTEIEQFEKKEGHEPFTLFNFKASLKFSKPENLEKLEKIIKEYDDRNPEEIEKIKNELEKYKDKFEEMWNKFDEIMNELKEIEEWVKKCGFQNIKDQIEETTKEEYVEKDINEFKKGLGIGSWNPIIKNTDTKRFICNEIEKAIEDERKNIFVIGESGSGKTILLKRIAYDFYQKGWKVYWRIASIGEENLIDKIKNDENALVVIDKAYEVKEKILALVKRVCELPDKNICVLLAERKEKTILKEMQDIVNELKYPRYNYVEQKDINLVYEDVSTYLKNNRDDLTEEDISKIADVFEMYANSPGSFSMLIELGNKENFPPEKLKGDIKLVVENLKNYKCDKIKEELEKINDEVNKGILKEILMRIFAISAYEGKYSKYILERQNIAENVDFYLDKLQKHIVCLISIDAKKDIATFHPWVCREYLIKEIEKVINFRKDVRGYLKEFPDAISSKEYLSVLYTIGTNIAIEADKEKDNEKREIGVKYFEKVIKINPNDAEAHNNLGNLLQNLKRYEEAEKEYREAIRINPNDADAHNNLGNLLKDLKRYEEAEKEYREAIRINPNLAEAHNNLGNLLKDLKRYEEAEKEYREAIRLNLNDADAHNNLGALLANLKRYEEAEKEFREAIRINPNDAEAHNNLGNLLADLNRYEEAEKEYREAIRINPNYTEAHNGLGILLSDLKRYEEAEKEYREAIRLNPDYAGAHFNLGILLVNLKRYEEAEKEYGEAIRINPNYAEAHANLGILFFGLNDAAKLGDGISELEIAFNLKENLPDKGERVFEILKNVYESFWKDRNRMPDKSLFLASKLSDLYLGLGDGNNALKWLNETWNLKELLDDDGMAELNLKFAHAYSLIKDKDNERQKILEAKDLFQKSGNVKMVERCAQILEELKILK